MILEWNNLHVKLPNMNTNIKKEYFHVLKDISGKIRSGQLLALMGKSGSGKSTLLDILVGTISENTITQGNIFIDGKNRDDIEWYKTIAYVPQKYQFWNDLTARETIEYSYKFKNDYKTINPTKITTLIKTLDLDEVLDNKMSKLSSGERKRIMVACALICNPSIIFLDEPVSGLDTLTAQKIIVELKRQAVEYKKIIIVSIHQPSSYFFKMFDELLLLKNGEMIYSGPIKSLPDLLQSRPDYVPVNEYILTMSSNGYAELLKHTGPYKEPTQDWKNTNSSYMNYKPKLSEILILFKRRLLLKKRKPMNFFKYSLPGLSFFSFFLIISFFSICKLLGEFYTTSFEKNMIVNYFDFSMLFDVLKSPLIVISQYLISGVSNSFINEMAIIKGECAAFYYSSTSYYLSVLAYELIYNYFFVFLGFFAVKIFYSTVNSMLYIYFLFISPIILIPISLFIGTLSTSSLIISTFNSILSIIICLSDSMVRYLEKKPDIKNIYKALLWILSIFLPVRYFINIMSYCFISDITFKNESFFEYFANHPNFSGLPIKYNNLLVKYHDTVLPLYIHWIVTLITPIFFILVSTYTLNKLLKPSIRLN
ncbi:ABC transporter G family member 12 [Astathelohania contejeani]|uniref:ABC transporter G family member 12 n=1 Tax=Astathelohania contejeani TaxID=164912 RepID=A0ABQ7I100_9MICR|nr:ABC transporter G family member 12 [Thelohania contejeani]